MQAVLFRGEGGAFCSGLDLGEFNADPPPSWMADWRQIWRRAHKAIYLCEKPIIGALERYAINGGAALIIACDFTITGEGAFLQVGEMQLGMGAPYNPAWLALRHPEVVCAELALIGDRVSGPELVRLGIARAAVADEQVLNEALSIYRQTGELSSRRFSPYQAYLQRIHRARYRRMVRAGDKALGGRHGAAAQTIT